MMILELLGFFVIFWQCKINVSATSDFVIEPPTCKHLKNASAPLRLKDDLFCDYDSTVRPNHHKIVTNVTVALIPQLAEIEGDAGMFILHTMLLLIWKDIHLTWTPSSYEGITTIHVKSYEIWKPDLEVFNSGDMSHSQTLMPTTECHLSNTGNVICVSYVKYISRCDVDHTYFPYDKQECQLLLGSWMYLGDNIDFQFKYGKISMANVQNNLMWDIKFLEAKKEILMYQTNDTYQILKYIFSATQHSNIKHASIIVPAITLIFLTLTVFWLDSRSVERIVVANVNFICHIWQIGDLHWQLPYNGINTPHILIFYRDSLALATFALILTVVLRKLQSMNTEMPNWISYITTFVLRYQVGRFLILNNEESKISSEGKIDIPKSEVGMKELSWRHFAAIVELLSFFCVSFTYIIILIILVPTG